MVLWEYNKAVKLLKHYGLHSIDSTYVNSYDDAVKFAKTDRIVLKLISQKALHKSKAGLVKLDLASEKEIKNAFDDLKLKGRKLVPYKIQAQKMSRPGVEIIVGGREDQQFGKLILLGLGGIYVETFRDFALRVCPITEYDAREMINQLRSKKVVTYDGVAEKMLVKILLNVSRMLERNKFKALDLNPVIIRKDGYEVVDIRVLE